ncbi:MAG: outer-membrane lipoprotein carrier protein LolA [bacterium]|nr:outer-membrane lipoprotein carrier protein LolA [bacterium]
MNVIFGVMLILLSPKNLPERIDKSGNSQIDKIISNYQNIESVYGRMTRYYSVNNIKERSTGKFYLRKPKKLYIKYFKPEQTIILNNSVLWICYPDKKQAVKTHYSEFPEIDKKLSGIDILLSFNFITELKKSFDIAWQDSIHLIATPKGDDNISKIIFEVDPQKNVILNEKTFDSTDKLIYDTNYQDWELVEGMWFPQDIVSEFHIDGKDIKEKVRFSEIFINYEIADKQFKFVAPKGVTIIN